MRKTIFANEEYYHVYNRGVEKRDIFSNACDQQRFLQGMVEFNTLDPIGSIYQNSFRKKTQLRSSTSKFADKDALVAIVAYCLNPNHYHFVLQQVADHGVEKYMQRIGTGYTNYFNNKHERSGGLFQGKFKAIHIDSNEYLLHISAYVNLNDRVHQLGSSASQSSWDEYTNGGDFCEKECILGQFGSVEEYRDFAQNSLQGIIERRGGMYEQMQEFLLER